MESLHLGTTGRASPDDGPLLPARAVWSRYGVSDRTLDRWIGNAALGFPKPVIINKRRYFRERQLQAWEVARAKSAAA